MFKVTKQNKAKWHKLRFTCNKDYFPCSLIAYYLPSKKITYLIIEMRYKNLGIKDNSYYLYNTKSETLNDFKTFGGSFKGFKYQKSTIIRYKDYILSIYHPKNNQNPFCIRYTHINNGKCKCIFIKEIETRGAFSCCIINNYLIIHGGIQHKTKFNDGYIINLLKLIPKNEINIKKLDFSSEKIEIYGHALIPLYNNSIYIFGVGIDYLLKNIFNDKMIIDKDLFRKKPILRKHEGFYFSKNKKLYIFGGEWRINNQRIFLNDLYILQLIIEYWANR